MSFQRQSTSPVRGHRKKYRQSHNLFPAAENPKDPRVVTQWQVGKPILRLYYNMVKMAGFECGCICIPLSACVCVRKYNLFVYASSAVTLSVWCAFFSIFFCLYTIQILDNALFFS